MSNFNHVTLLDIVEAYAEDNGLISSEEALSERFDEEIAPIIIEQYGEVGVAFDDDVAMSEGFNNWTDALCKEGDIHDEQYQQYCYVGKWA